MAAVNLTAEGLAAGWRAVEVNSTGDEKAVAEAVAMYRRMLLAVLLRLLERSERDSSYGFLDMKVDLITGEDFAAADEIRGKGTIYGWIQGRGLEALAGHAQWLMRSDIAIPGLDRPSLTARIHTVARRAVEKLEHLRAGNGGHLSFMMRDGKAMTLRNGKLVPKQVSDNPGTNVSDLFYAKGLAAAAVMLGDASRFDEAKNLLRRVIADVRAGRFSSDQEQLDARNPVGVVEGRIGHGPRMLLVGAAALMVQLTCDREWVALGDEMIAAVLHRHVNLQMKGRHGEPFDMWEFVGPLGQQYLESGPLLRSDPGHATEFVGLSLKFLRECQEKDLLATGSRIDELRGLLFQTLAKNFANGFSKNAIGICKAFDLKSRQATNTDMPWWNLPETMRAAVEAAACATSEAQRGESLEIVRLCSNAFMKYYVRPDRWLMANQTVDEEGRVAERVPATPDADPGYHTGLSIIDCLNGRMLA